MPAREEEAGASSSGRKQVVIRIDKDLLRRVDMLGVEWDAFRSQVIDRLLRWAVENAEKQKVLA